MNIVYKNKADRVLYTIGNIEKNLKEENLIELRPVNNDLSAITLDAETFVDECVPHGNYLYIPPEPNGEKALTWQDRFANTGVTPKGAVFRHFKGQYYVVIARARYSEDHNERLIYYKSLNINNLTTSGDWIRPEGMFLGKVDTDKYPEANQEYRFEYSPSMTRKYLQKIGVY